MPRTLTVTMDFEELVHDMPGHRLSIFRTYPVRYSLGYRDVAYSRLVALTWKWNAP